MSLSRPLIAVTLALAFSVSATAFAAGDAARGKVLSYTCLGCHGIEDYRNAYPDYNVPRLAGQHADYIVAALKEYKDGERQHATMQVQAATLSDQDMADIAAYFASEAAVKPEASSAAVPAKVSQLCVSCHGKDGVGVTSAYPSLANQQASYIEQAIDEYKDGERKNAVMGTFVPSLSAQDISEIADYYAAQTPGLKTLERQLTFLSSK
ncbi:MAG TPA: cytochrome c [Steroidobacteraceae bacterium]|nr:cytochrome c [Steroidobacteraceae bacterium]